MAVTDDTDDPTIPDEAILWRRIPPWHFVRDENLGRVRPSKAAFADHPDGSPMSIFFADEVLAAGRRAEDVLAGHGGFALAAISAGQARSLQQSVIRRPTPDEPSHGEVIGKKTNSVKRALAKLSLWVVPPTE